jgi:hypothetical protein
VGASMADGDVVRARGRSAAAFIARASRLGFKPSQRRRYPGLQCHGTATRHRWARSAEEVTDGPRVTGVRAGGDFGRDTWPKRTFRGCNAWANGRGPASACVRWWSGAAWRDAQARLALGPARRRG